MASFLSAKMKHQRLSSPNYTGMKVIFLSGSLINLLWRWSPSLGGRYHPTSTTTLSTLCCDATRRSFRHATNAARSATGLTTAPTRKPAPVTSAVKPWQTLPVPGRKMNVCQHVSSAEMAILLDPLHARVSFGLRKSLHDRPASNLTAASRSHNMATGVNHLLKTAMQGPVLGTDKSNLESSRHLRP